MTLISTLSIVGMFFSIASYFVWKEDLYSVPVLYPWGVILNEWWFLGRGSQMWRSKLPHANWALDGLPYVASAPLDASSISELGKVGFPYASSYNPVIMQNPAGNDGNNEFEAPEVSTINLYNIQQNYEKGEKLEKYTPIKGMYGVEVSEPKAMKPNDYIAKALLGPDKSAQDMVLESLNSTGSLDSGVGSVYNQHRFKGGITPFISQLEGPNAPNDTNWQYLNLYQVPTDTGSFPFMAPLVSTNGGINSTMYTSHWGNVNNGNTTYYTSQTGYSGSEYPTDPANYGTLEYKTNITYDRPPWYDRDYIGESTGTTATYISAFSGTTSGVTNDSGWILTPDFTNIKGGLPNPQYWYIQYGWGSDNPSKYSNTVVRSEKDTVELLPTEVQAAYINDFLLHDISLKPPLADSNSTPWYTDPVIDPAVNTPFKATDPYDNISLKELSRNSKKR